MYKTPWHYTHSDIQHLNSSRDIERAKYMALLWYLICLLAYLVWPAILIWNIMYGETLTFVGLPESEGPAAIGQWGPWVGFGLSGMLVIMYELRKRQVNQGQTGDRLPLTTRDEANLASNSSIDDQNQRHLSLSKAVEIAVEEWSDLCTWWRNPVEGATADSRDDISENRETVLHIET